MARKRCFVIMPFSGTTEEHTTQYWDTFFSSFIKPSVEQLGYACSRSKAQVSNIIKDVIAELNNADVVLAVLSDFNPNVWYELGVRHALRSGTIMVLEEGQSIPFDISAYGVLTYRDSIAGASEFQQGLKECLHRIETEQPIDSPARDFLQLGTQTDDAAQRVQELQADYGEKLDRIMALLQGREPGDAAAARAKPVERRRKVLWVDDYPRNNEVIIDLFRRQNVGFDLALSTEQAMDRLAAEQYDLVISDMGRGPERDAGLRLVRQVGRQFGTHPPIVIFASGRAIQRFGDDARREGAMLVTNSAQELVTSMAKVLQL